MSLSEREVTSLSADDLERLVDLERPPSVEPAEVDRRSGSRTAAVLLASLAAAAGVVHLVMVPSHAGEWLPEGVAFAVAGWVQIGLALLFVARPSRVAIRVSCLANVLFIGAWLVSRVWGWPVGPEAFVPHAASFIDVVCVGLEVALVLAGYEVLAKPELGAKLRDTTKVALSIVPIGILVLATVAITSPSAVGHGHTSASGSTASADHDHGTPAAAGAAGGAVAGDHDHGTPTTAADPATPVDDKGLSLIMNGAGEGGGHVHSNEVVPVDAATQAQLDAQLAAMKPLMEKFPTVKDAEAAGYHRQGPYSPGLGAHYAEAGRPNLNTGPTVEGEALKHPMLIFDGVAPDSKLAGFMYLIFSLDTENPPEGFVGPNDHWHYHTNVCIVPDGKGGTDAPLGADASATKELCDKYKGFLIANTGYMAHVWPVPGYESPQGMFSNLNPKMTCPNGTYYVVAQEEIGTRANACKDVPA